MSAPRTVVLVEGESDRVALLALADRLGSDVASHGAEVVAMGGITNVRAFAERHGPHGLGQRLAGLYDVDEERHVRRGLLAAGLLVDDVEGPAGRGFHACHADLEDELVRSVGLDGVEAVIEDAGEARSLRLLAQMPAQEGWAREQLVRRFLGSQSGRKAHYARLLVEVMDLRRAPAPLVAVIERATAT
ncbi:TOPRIM nucleotidyl transferase/hydrolase domain-containing protein [Janibacter limosus]|uniref:TOPRIM nucleotidyl transferase/hydrolase domain-containing protein n=1 Tax=Janibacter limosus TaxID=53458 RepID=UPI00082CA047|nr:TOPRIM nucleotidyl transferase/hydrolase domain-containing protein [Janibacter limosus]